MISPYICKKKNHAWEKWFKDLQTAINDTENILKKNKIEKIK